MRHYCTYFDRNYLLRGLTLYRSLKRFAQPFTLWVLCLDDFTFDTLRALALPDVRPIALSEFENGDEALLAAKAARGKVEYIFTCSPSWPLYLLKHFPDIELIAYLDSDLLFFSDPAPIYQELGNNSILIVPHRFPAYLRHFENHGIYNVGLLMFRNDAEGRACLEYWRERCLDWCGLYPDGERFADQKYLDEWPNRYTNVTSLKHTGAGLAPWNWMNSKIQTIGDMIMVDGKPLIFYHYQGLRIFNQWIYDPATESETYGMMPIGLRWRVHHPYITAIKETLRWLRKTTPSLDIGLTKISDYGSRKFFGKLRKGRLMLDSDMK